MPHEIILTNARIVTADEIVSGSLAIRDGKIADLDARPSALPEAQNLEGDYLMPGLIELHTDNLEKHMSPRPGVDWPPLSAAITHDAQVVASGITTVFDAISIGEIHRRGQRLATLMPMLEAVDHATQHGLLRAEHRLHLRCEVVHPETLGLFERLAGHPRLSLVSIMDHSPGQRQYVSLDKYRVYYQGKYGLNDDEIEELIEVQSNKAKQNSDRQRKAIAAHCAARRLPLASHDDATAAHAEESAALGMAIAEFPTTLEAARTSRQKGLKVLMGAPNVIRGGSHSGNVSARALAEEGVLDILSSDYYPSSLLHAAMTLAGTAGHTLPAAINTVSRTPARAVGLADRGEIKPGLRADLIQARLHQGHPLIRQVWQQGDRIF
ncbi:MAG: alpha-D-ribose 1-methylphosphonate 5-triphosphate diphosphatase [Azoarcus sp.]|jgi:alpha-D-ribose 1-methylphosphonate 5-triphosphate diphosphatase|nr:alpha-D-ribose 1-methylphosphonate 5-triphosphate diphosphatase [Azoarcus sp.]